MHKMIPAGYMAKRVANKPEWLTSDSVVDIYSLSNCISPAFAEYIHYWQHNGYWLFNSPDDIRTLAAHESIDLLETTLFYYEVYEFEFDEDKQAWSSFQPETSTITAVQVPPHKYLAGFDVATFSARTSPECSPLSCNSLATFMPVNPHCLCHTFEEASAALENGLFRNSEPGPFRIFAVYTI